MVGAKQQTAVHFAPPVAAVDGRHVFAETFFMQAFHLAKPGAKTVASGKAAYIPNFGLMTIPPTFTTGYPGDYSG